MKLKKAQKHKSVMKWVLAGVFVVLVGAMIVTISNSFLNVSTSTSTKAAVRNQVRATGLADKTDATICAEKVSAISNGVKPSIKVLAGSGNGKCQDNGSGNVSAWWGTGILSSDFPKQCIGVAPYRVCSPVTHNLDCCINSNDYTKIGTAFCNSFSAVYDSKGNAISPKPDAKCKESCDTTDGYNNVLYYNSSTNPNGPLNLSVAAWCKTTKSNAGVPTKIQGKCCFKF